MIARAEASSTPQFPTLRAECNGESSVKQESREAASETVLRRTFAASDKEILTLAQRLYDRHSQDLPRSQPEITADAAEVPKRFVQKGSPNSQKSPQIRRIRAKRAHSQKTSLDLTASVPLTPRPPSLSVVCSSIQSELGQSANEESSPKLMTLNQFWEQKSADMERLLRIEHGDCRNVGEEHVEGIGSLRPCAGSLDRDPALSATTLPSSHVEAWLSIVLARCGEELNVFYEQANELRQSVGLAPIPTHLPDIVARHCSVHAKARPATVSLTEDCAYISPQEVHFEPRSEKNGNPSEYRDTNPRGLTCLSEPQTRHLSENGVRRIKSALGKNEGKEMCSQWLSNGKQLFIESTHETENGTRLPRGLKKPVHSSESRGKSYLSSADTTLLRKFRADRLALLALDRQTLEALGLDSATVDRTYRALYVHSVGAHLLVRRACKHTAPKYRAKLAAALWLMFMYLVEGTEDIQYKSAVSQLRIASAESMKKASWKFQIDSARERDARRAAENEAREVDSFVAALVADTAKTKELQREGARIALERDREHFIEIQRAEGAKTELLEICKRHEAQAAKGAVSLALSACELDNCKVSLSTAYAKRDTITSELEAVRHHRNELQKAYNGVEQDRMTLVKRISSLESRVKRSSETTQSLRSEQSRRLVLDSKHVSIQTDATQLNRQDSLRIWSDGIDAKGDSKNAQIAHSQPSLGAEIDCNKVAIREVLRLIQLVERNLSILRVTHTTELRAQEGLAKNMSPIDATPAPSTWKTSTCAILPESEPEQQRAPATCEICLDTPPTVEAVPLPHSRKLSNILVGAPTHAPTGRLDQCSATIKASPIPSPISRRQSSSSRLTLPNTVDGHPFPTCKETPLPAQREAGFANQSMGTSCEQNIRPRSQVPERTGPLEVSQACARPFEQISGCLISHAPFDPLDVCTFSGVEAEGHDSPATSDPALLSSRQVVESPAPALTESVTGCLEEFQDKYDEVSAAVTSTNAVLQIAAQETAAKLLGVSWMRAYIQSLGNEHMMRLRVDYLSNRLNNLENEALPASIAAFAAHQAIGMSVRQKLEIVRQTPEDATNERTCVENRMQLGSTKLGSAENGTNLRARITVLQKTALELGTQRDQAHEMTLQARKRLLESQKTLEQKSQLLADFHAREKVREEEHVTKLNSLRHAKDVAESQTAKLKQQNAVLSEKLRRILQDEFAQADARATASAQLFRATVSSINRLLAEHSRRTRQEAEDWRRRGLLNGPRITSMLVKYVRETSAKCFREGTRCKLPPATETYDPWPTEIISISSIDKAVDEEVVRPAIDLTVVGAALETALGNFFDQEAVDHAYTCMINSTTGYNRAKLQPCVRPRISNIALRMTSSRNRQDHVAVLPCGECIQSLGIMAGNGLQANATKISGVTPPEGHQLHVAMTTAAAAAVRRLGRELSLVQQETQSSNKERDYLMRQIVEHYARYGRLNSRCESLAADVKCAERDHRVVLEQKERHHRKLIANARRLKEHCEAEMKKVAGVVSDAVSSEREAQEKIGVLQELTCMASADGESRELRSWERAFMAHTLTAVEQALMAAKSAWIKPESKKLVSRFEEKSALPPGATGSESPNQQVGTDFDVSYAPAAATHFNEAEDCHHALHDAQLSNVDKTGAFSKVRHLQADWFEQPTILNLNRIWMSPQQRALFEIRGTCERLTKKFSNVQERYLGSCKRVQELSRALLRMTAEHIKLQTSYQQELQRNMEAVPHNEDGANVNSGFNNAGDPKQPKLSSKRAANIGHGNTAKDVGHDASVQTGLTLLCRRQVQTDLSWVHGCLQSQHSIQVPPGVKNERLHWTDASPMIETPSGRHIKLQCDLLREPGGTKVVPKSDRLTVAVSESGDLAFTESASSSRMNALQEGVEPTHSRDLETCIPSGLITPGDSIVGSQGQCKVESTTEVEHRTASQPTVSSRSKANATSVNERVSTGERINEQEQNCEISALCPDSTVSKTQSTLDFARINIPPGNGAGSNDMLNGHVCSEAFIGAHYEMPLRTNDTSSSKTDVARENVKIRDNLVAHAAKQADDESLLEFRQTNSSQANCGDILIARNSVEPTYSVSQIVIAEAAVKGQNVPHEIEVALALIARYRQNLMHIDVNVESNSRQRDIANLQIDAMLQSQAKIRTNASIQREVSLHDFPEITTNTGDVQIPAFGDCCSKVLAQEKIDDTCYIVDQVRANAGTVLKRESSVPTLPSRVDDYQRGSLHCAADTPFTSKESVASRTLNVLQLRDARIHEDNGTQTRAGKQDEHNALAFHEAPYSESPSKGDFSSPNLRTRESRNTCRDDNDGTVTWDKDATKDVDLVREGERITLMARIRELIDCATDSVSQAEAISHMDEKKASTQSTEQEGETTRLHFPASLLDSIKAATRAGHDPFSSMHSWFDDTSKNMPDKETTNAVYLQKLVFAANNAKKDALAASKARLQLLTSLADTLECSEKNTSMRTVDIEHPANLNQSYTMSDIALERRKERAALSQIHKEHYNEEGECSLPGVQKGRITDAHFRVRSQASSRRSHSDAGKTERSFNASEDIDDEASDIGNDVPPVLDSG